VTPLAFLRLPEVERTLAMAQQAAALPLSVHTIAHGEEGLRLMASGGCTICQHIAQLPGGRAACRASRSPASADALSQARPVAFVCHAGLSCISFPLVDAAPFAATLGPFLPDAAPPDIELILRERMAELAEDTQDSVSLPLDDVRRVPVSAPVATATWLRDALGKLWQEQHPEVQTSSPSRAEETKEPPSRPRRLRVPEASFQPEQVALLLASGNTPRARRLLLESIEQRTRSHTGAAIPAGAPALAMTAAVLEAAARASMDTARAQEILIALAQEVQAAVSPKESIAVVMKVLRCLVPRRSKTTDVMARYAALDALITHRLQERITLNEVAQELGETPSAITHRLQRKFGLSFSEYIGRLRVEEAKRLLRRTRLTATEVAHRVGVRDQSQFSKLFKRHEGLTPTAFRERYGR